MPLDSPQTWTLNDLTLDNGRLYSDASKIPSGGDPGDPLFFDDFDYAVGRTDSSASKLSAFQTAGWGGYKDTESSAGAGGHIYTVTSIEGFEGTFPGDSGRALCLEAHPETIGEITQADFYLQYGSTPTLGNLPAEVWFQYWFYLQRDEGSSKVSEAPTGKFLYPLHGARTSYPEHPLDMAWLFGCFNNVCDPTTGLPSITPPETGAFTYICEANGSVDGSTALEDVRLNIPAQRAVGYPYGRATANNDLGFTHFLPNRWYLVKMHFNVSATGGAYEMWAREKGTLTFTKMAEYIDGQNDIQYQTFQGVTHAEGDTQDHMGPRLLRMPTTAGSDYWKYLADFTIAEAEEDLPTYGSY